MFKDFFTLLMIRKGENVGWRERYETWASQEWVHWNALNSISLWESERRIPSFSAIKLAGLQSIARPDKERFYCFFSHISSHKCTILAGEHASCIFKKKYIHQMKHPKMPLIHSYNRIQKLAASSRLQTLSFHVYFAGLSVLLPKFLRPLKILIPTI